MFVTIFVNYKYKLHKIFCTRLFLRGQPDPLPAVIG